MIKSTFIGILLIAFLGCTENNITPSCTNPLIDSVAIVKCISIIDYADEIKLRGLNAIK